MSDVILRRAEGRDASQIMEIIDSAKAYMKACGVAGRISEPREN